MTCLQLGSHNTPLWISQLSEIWAVDSPLYGIDSVIKRQFFLDVHDVGHSYLAHTNLIPEEEILLWLHFLANEISNLSPHPTHSNLIPEAHLYFQYFYSGKTIHCCFCTFYCCDTWRDWELVSLAHTELQVLHKKVAATARNNISLTSLTLTLPNWK